MSTSFATSLAPPFGWPQRCNVSHFMGAFAPPSFASCLATVIVLSFSGFHVSPAGVNWMFCLWHKMKP